MANKIQHQQALAAKFSIYGSTALFLISAASGIAVDSITLILDASASLVIMAVAYLMHFSIKKIHLPPDDTYNFGYNKYEPLTVAVQGGLIIATCVISIKFAIQDIIHAEDIHNYVLPVVATLLSSLIGVSLFAYISNAARRTNSSMLKAAALHWFTDTVLSFAIFSGFLFGLLLHRLGYYRITPYIDPVMTIALALFLVRSPIKGLLRNVRELLDAVPDASIRSKVKKVAQSYIPKSFGISRIRTRKAGEKIFIDACLIVKDNLTVGDIKELADSFEADLKSHLANCDVVVYFKPAKAG